ncbi:MAG: hypothetical protein HOQ03_06610 [Thermoleophilia bacterium]|nr:hypothetical protein [Thermoleophilia bacterium]
MQPEHVEAIAAAWPGHAGTTVETVRAFLAESVPDVDACALRQLGAAGKEPQILAVAGRQLYRIESAEEAGRRGLGFVRLPLSDATVTLLELRDDQAVRRRWTLRTREEGLSVETVQARGEEPPALERLMRLVLERAD